MYEDCVLTGEFSYGLPSHATVFQAKLVAILKALEVCGSRRDMEIIIFSDSRSSLQELANPSSLDPICARIHELRGGMAIQWFWVKAHVGITGNETADRSVKAGTELTTIDVHVNMCLPPPRFVKTRIGTEILSLWLERWDEEETGRDVYSIPPKVSESHAWTTPILNWASTGHGPPRIFPQVQSPTQGPRMPILYRPISRNERTSAR